MITVTESAAKQLHTLLTEHDAPTGSGLRIAVESGGCSGMQYNMGIDSAKPEDEISERDGVKVLVDPASAGYLRDCVLDYSDGLTGAGFRIQNPAAKRTCGCGTSFEPDEAAAAAVAGHA